jgi:hypothetical protein
MSSVSYNMLPAPHTTDWKDKGDAGSASPFSVRVQPPRLNFTICPG